MMNDTHDNYVRQILNQEDKKNTKPILSKKFWKYIKSRKKIQWEYHPQEQPADPQEQPTDWTSFMIVSLRQRIPTNMPNIENQLHIRTEGFEKQLTFLHPTKANGLDELPTRISNLELHCF